MSDILRRAKEGYRLRFPDYPPVVLSHGWLYGIWMIGQNYRSKQGYYGEYPPSYLRRVGAMFPDKQRVLHLFSGVVGKERWAEEWTLDRKSDLIPDFCLDVSESGWTKQVRTVVPDGFDLILADPPYSEEDARHYGTSLIHRNQVVRDTYSLMAPDCHLLWLDQVLPMFRRSEVRLVGTIGIVRSTNHRFRILSIFDRATALAEAAE